MVWCRRGGRAGLPIYAFCRHAGLRTSLTCDTIYVKSTIMSVGKMFMIYDTRRVLKHPTSCTVNHQVPDSGKSLGCSHSPHTPSHIPLSLSTWTALLMYDFVHAWCGAVYSGDIVETMRFMRIAQVWRLAPGAFPPSA